MKGGEHMCCLDGEIAMVTGGGTGIGAAITEDLAAKGVNVACCFNVSQGATEALARKLGGAGKIILPVKMDVCDSQEVRSAVEATVRHFGRPITILINNAGDIIKNAPIEYMDEGLWDKVMAINLRGAFLCAKYCVPGMKSANRGRIVNISSISARTGGGSGGVHYVASKGGLEAFTRALAKELAPFNITVNAVAPGDIYTRMHERYNTPENLEKMRQQIPMARLGNPAEIAKVVSFLVSDDASYMTGEIVAVNGGKRMD